MARKPRLDLDGFHHIVNRGVARSNVYKSDEDKEIPNIRTNINFQFIYFKFLEQIIETGSKIC